MKHIAVVNGAHCCYETTSGRDRIYSGCAHKTPREAIRHTGNHPYTSPLRAAGTGAPVTDPSTEAVLAPIPASR